MVATSRGQQLKLHVLGCKGHGASAKGLEMAMGLLQVYIR
jgi:hypothetical protein